MGVTRRGFPCSGSLTSSCGQEFSLFSNGLSIFLSLLGNNSSLVLFFFCHLIFDLSYLLIPRLI